MDSIKSFKGYGKVDDAENLAFKRKARRRLIIIIVSTVALLSLIIALSIAFTVNKNTDKDTVAPSFSNSIKAICNLTQYPDSCVTSISSIKGANTTTDPEQLFKLSLQVASDALSALASFPDSISIPTKDARLKRAISDCTDMFQEAIDRVQESISSVTPTDADEKMLTAPKINDIRTWLSAAMTNQESCLDGFEGTTEEEKLKQKFGSAMKNSSEFISNSLAIVSGMQDVLKDLNFEMHRKLLSWEGPEWIQEGQRRVLLQVGSDLIPNVTVAKDGSGQVKTINEAVLMIPKKSMERYVIRVKKGVYEENVVLDKSKWNVIIFGDGMYDTVVTGSLNFIDGTPTFSTATFAVAGRGFMARDMGFKNTAGPDKHQAVAFRSGSDRSIFHRCNFEGYQDTLYAHSNRQFYRECTISGTIDFMFGNGAAVFQKCTITPLQPLPNQKNIITAQGRKDRNENTGIVIQGCTVSASGDVSAPTFLGRPWKDFSTTVFMQTEIGSVVDKAGWLSWVPGVDPPETIYYAEFQNTGPGAGVEGRVKWAGYRPEITAEEATRYTVHQFLEGTEWIPQAGVLFDSTL